MQYCINKLIRACCSVIEPCSCLGEGVLRLVDTITPAGTIGRLEIYLQGEWGTVCDDSFGQTEANVACRELGFASAARFNNVGEFG